MQFTWALSSSDLSGTAALANMTAYVTSVANAGTGSQVLTLPSSYLSAGTLAFTLTLKNFLDGMATSDTATVRVRSDGYMPTVTVRPGSLRCGRQKGRGPSSSPPIAVGVS